MCCRILDDNSAVFSTIIYTGVLATLEARHRQAVDAQAMPFANGSVRAVYAIHCFHHLPDPAAFLEGRR